MMYLIIFFGLALTAYGHDTPANTNGATHQTHAARSPVHTNVPTPVSHHAAPPPTANHYDGAPRVLQGSSAPHNATHVTINHVAPVPRPTHTPAPALHSPYREIVGPHSPLNFNEWKNFQGGHSPQDSIYPVPQVHQPPTLCMENETRHHHRHEPPSNSGGSGHSKTDPKKTEDDKYKHRPAPPKANSNDGGGGGDDNDNFPGPPGWYVVQFDGPAPADENDGPDNDDDDDGPPPFRGNPPPQSIVIDPGLQMAPTLEINEAAIPPVTVLTPRVILAPLYTDRRRFRRLPQIPTGERSEREDENDSLPESFPGGSAFESREDLEKYMKDSIDMLPDEYKNNYMRSVGKLCQNLSAQLSKEAKKPVVITAQDLRVIDFDVAVDPRTENEVFEAKGLIPTAGGYRSFSATLSYKK